MATCSKRKVSFFIRDILCAESSNHVTLSNRVTSSNIVTSLNHLTAVAGDNESLRHSEDIKGRETRLVSEGRSINNVVVNSDAISNSSCHTKNTLSRNDTSGIVRTNSHISESSHVDTSDSNNTSGTNNSNSSANNSISSSNKNNNSSSNNKSSNSSNNNSTKTSTDSNIISNNNKSSNNLKENDIKKNNYAKLKDSNFNNIKATSLQQQPQQLLLLQQQHLQQQHQHLPAPIPLVPGHHWSSLTSDQRLSLLPTSGTGEVCTTWGGVRPPYLYASPRGLGPLVPGGAPPAPGLHPRGLGPLVPPAPGLHPLHLPGGLPPVPASPGGGGYGRGMYGGGEGGHRCVVYKCGCSNGDVGTSAPLSHPGLQYLGGPVSYPAYPPPISRTSVPVPIPLPGYLRTRASPNNDGNNRPRKCRRSRTVFSELQLMGLERRFDDQKYLSTPDRGELARTLGLTQVQVKTWYQNRRMKWKKQVLQGGATEPPTKPKGRPRKEQQQVVTMDTTASSTANQHSDRPEVTCQDVPHVNMSTGEEDDVDCETGSDSDCDEVMNDVCDIGSDVDSDIDVQIT